MSYTKGLTYSFSVSEWCAKVFAIKMIMTDDVMTRKGFPHYWPFVDFRITGPLWGNPQRASNAENIMVSHVELWSLVFFAWTSSRVAGDLKRHVAHVRSLKRLFRRRSKKTSKLCITGLCKGNSPVTGEFPSQRASDAENVSIWWRHRGSADLLACVTAVRISWWLAE